MAKVSNAPNNYFGLGLQTAKDTEQATPAKFFFFKHLDGTGFDVDMNVTAEREGGDGLESGLHYKEQITFDGGVTVNARSGAVARLGGWALGQDIVVATNIASALFDHIAAPAASAPYLTAEQLAPDDVLERSNNNVFTGMTWEWEAGKPLKITAPFMSGGSLARRDPASAMTVTRETAKPFQYPGASVSLTINDDAGAPATSIKVTKGKVDFKRGVDDGVYTTGLNREDLPITSQDTDVDITVRYEDTNLYRRAYYGGGSQLQTELATGTLNLYSARGSFFHQLNVPLLEITGAKLNRLDPDGKTVYLDLAAMTVKNATYALYALTRTTDATSYLTP